MALEERDEVTRRDLPCGYGSSRQTGHGAKGTNSESGLAPQKLPTNCQLSASVDPPSDCDRSVIEVEVSHGQRARTAEKQQQTDAEIMQLQTPKRIFTAGVALP
jgi:hypothetical protein